MPLPSHKIDISKGKAEDSEQSVSDFKFGSQWGTEPRGGKFSAVRLPATYLHRDISPRNILTTKFDMPSLGDLAFAHAEGELRTGYVEVLRENARLRTELADLRSEVKEVRILLLQLRENLFDLSPIILFEVDSDTSLLRLNVPRNIAITLTPDGKLLCGVDEEFGIDAFARSRPELIREIHSQLSLVWNEYAKVDDAVLSPEAQSLKARLLSSITEISDAR